MTFFIDKDDNLIDTMEGFAILEANLLENKIKLLIKGEL